MEEGWPFDDAPDTACYTTKFVLDGAPILRVYHDYDGDWQFHGADDQPATASVAKIVCLADVVALDAALTALHDLPYGWRAERRNTSESWQRACNHPFAVFSDDGYYLEDSAWLAEFLEELNPPPPEISGNLAVGQYVKLVFRFADESAERSDYECEWMWVQITEVDEEGHYSGTLENEPHHDALSIGDLICFHPLHVAEADTE